MDTKYNKHDRDIERQYTQASQVLEKLTPISLNKSIPYYKRFIYILAREAAITLRDNTHEEVHAIIEDVGA